MTSIKPKKDSSKKMEMSSDRNFGLIMASFFCIVALLPLRHHQEIHFWVLYPSAGFLLLALLAPKLLHPLNIAWMHFGDLLSKIISPLALGVVFYLAITPIALLLRLFGKKTLDLRIEKNANSYWKPRDPPGPTPQSMKDQF